MQLSFLSPYESFKVYKLGRKFEGECNVKGNVFLISDASGNRIYANTRAFKISPFIERSIGAVWVTWEYGSGLGLYPGSVKNCRGVPLVKTIRTEGS